MPNGVDIPATKKFAQEAIKTSISRTADQEEDGRETYANQRKYLHRKGRNQCMAAEHYATNIRSPRAFAHQTIWGRAMTKPAGQMRCFRRARFRGEDAENLGQIGQRSTQIRQTSSGVLLVRTGARITVARDFRCMYGIEK